VDSIWFSFTSAVSQEFSDIPNLTEGFRLLIRSLLAVICGGLLGYERERSGKSAGLRTHMLVALGSALFIMIPLQSGMAVPDISRVLQGIISGIGFLGAGAIIKFSDSKEIKGLTTAASIWLTAAIGVAVGTGRETTAILSTVFALIILAAIPKVEQRLSDKTAGDGDAPRKDA
jgi:putative Mg2+ transporter-C (MgtC) family protein